MKPYSLNVRTQVLAALDAGMARIDAVRVFQVSRSSITRWWAQRQRTGSLAPRPRPGKARTITRAQEPILRCQLTQFPDATLAEHAARWNADHGTHLSRWTIGRAIRRLGWSRKQDLAGA